MSAPAEGLNGDVVIADVRYPLFKDKDDDGNPSLGFRRDKAIPLQRTTEEGPIPAIYDKGFSAGAGFTQELQRGMDAYAFSAGMDLHEPGVMRLAGRRVTMTPTSPPVDAKTDFFEQAASAGTAEFFCGSFTKDTTAGTVTQSGISHGLAVTPKVIIFWTVNQTADGTVAAGTSNCIGFWAGYIAAAVSWASEDAVGTSNASRDQTASGSIFLTPATTSDTSVSDGTVVNVGASTFDINWGNNSTDASIIHFLAIGGGDVQAALKSFVLQTSIGSTSVTGVGFQPDVVMLLSASMLASPVATADAKMSFGVMDKNGNQWSTSIYSQDAQATSNTLSGSSATLCLNGIDSGGTAVAQSFVSMDADGFTTTGSANAADLVYALSLKGVQVLAGNFTKKTSATTEDAQTIGFTTEAFMVASTQATGLGATDDDWASFSLGGATGTTEVETMAWTDEDNQATTDTYAVSDTALAMEMLTVADGTEVSTATCANIDMETAGWLTWGAASGSAEYIFYLALAKLDNSAFNFVYAANGQRTTKMSVASNVITEEEQVDQGNDAACGFGTTFNGVRYQPLGKVANAVKLTNVTASTGDTWGALGSDVPVVAFTTQIDGSVLKLVRGRATTATGPANLVSLSSDDTTWGSDFDVGDETADIVKMVDSGVEFHVGKEDNLYAANGASVSWKLTDEVEVDESHGTGLTAGHGTKAAWYNHGALLFFKDEGVRPRDIGMDSNPQNRRIPNISYEPYRGEYLEGAKRGNWRYDLYRVTESSVTRTYIIASHFLRDRGLWIRHTYDRFDGVARGMYIDKKYRLWTAYATGGTYLYYQIGEDGSPDAGRNNIGYGAKSTTYYTYGSEMDIELEVTNKQLWQFFILARDIDATCPVQLIVHRDEGAEESVGSAITASSVSKVYWTNGTNDTATRFRWGVKIATTALYEPNPLSLSGTSTTIGTFSLADTSQVWPTNKHVGAVVTTSGGSTMTVTSNGSDTLAGTGGWTGGTPTAGETYTISGTATSTDPRVLVLGVRVLPRPDFGGRYKIAIDTKEPYRGTDDVPDAAVTIRDALQALEGGAPVSVTGPAGEALVLRFTSVSDLRVRGPDDDGEVHYVVDMVAEERTTP